MNKKYKYPEYSLKINAEKELEFYSEVEGVSIKATTLNTPRDLFLKDCLESCEQLKRKK